MHTYPDKKFEVVNLSLTAVNSYTIAGFAQELVDYEPDVVLIYTGHNEYYGALGVGSTDRIGGNRHIVGAILWLRQFRIVQLLTQVYEWIAGLFSKPADLSGKTRMKAMVGEQRIPYGSAMFTRGIDQFRTNMDKALSVLHERHIPVFISNLVSNEKDLAPFISAKADSLTYADFFTHYDRGLKALGDHDQGSAYTDLSKAEQAFGGHALCDYYLGRLTYGKGDTVQAGRWFAKARELDELRFRAPAAIDSIIDGFSRDYDNVHLVDTRSVFEAHSEGAIIGGELLLEHVHPNLYGYALMSDVFYTAMKQQGILGPAKEGEMSFPLLLASMPITRVDSLTGIYKVINLKSNWPFDEALAKDSIHTGSEEEQLAFDIAFKHMPWETAMSNLYDYYIREHDLEGARTVMETLLLEHPTEEAYYEKVANLYGALNRPEAAIFYFRQAFDLSPSFDKARFLFVLYLKLDKPAAALPYLDYAIQHNVSGADLTRVRQLTEQVIQLQNLAGKEPGNINLLRQIAILYIQMGNKEAAAKYNEIIQTNGGYKN
jgi:tetratricopeptide (TPR) repeat protein